jgi:hypothetical protein
MQDRPSKTELLQGVEYFLADEAIPQLTGPAQFHARVAANAVRMVLRELEGEEEDLRAEYRGLCGILNVDESQPETLGALRERVLQMNETLSKRLRAGETGAPAERARVLAHLREVTLRKLAVTNPAMREILIEELNEAQ